MAKEYLKDEAYVLVDAEENAQLAAKYGVMQAPTLVVADKDGFTKYANLSNIKKYVSQKAEQKHAMNA